ncbi:site-specific integrase [Coleofasciculus sp. FACHB-129]|uniref:site-specific integrase n=1 Tax=Cyanophyceae TaxID=3028117 RepID=UPI001689B8B8|nr:site-specific integrase [Coleofasciculus sp. FACHB-129]MBD1897917.1 site-specific integrase [Coleofasciculus sp. FACHB-129]
MKYTSTALLSHLTFNDARLALLSIGYYKNRGAVKPIFVGQQGQLNPHSIQNLIEKYKGDLEDFSPHSLGHTFCKNLIDAGVGLEMVAALAGHESLETTKRYCEPSPEDLALAVALISQED